MMYQFNGITKTRFDQALDRAYNAFARRNSEWTDSLFDRHFLTHTAAPLFAAYYQQGELPSAIILARLWARQLPTIDPAYQSQRIIKATIAAHDFLRRLSVELCATGRHPHTIPAGAEWDAALL